jgi:hypothetical protein
MATYASIKYDMDLSSNATGAGPLTLLSTQTASSSATISFTSSINSTYKEYIFKFYDIHPATSGQFTFQTSSNTGSSYGVTLTSTAFTAYHKEDGSDTILAYDTGSDLAQSTSFMRFNIGASLGNDNDESLAGTLTLYDPSSTTYIKHWMAVTNMHDSGTTAYAVNSFAAGYFNTTSAIDAVQFKMSSGNIDAGVIKMYGVA